jgi:hypothetical protein
MKLKIAVRIVVLLGMLFLFSGFLTNCPTINQPNNLCQELIYGSDLWSDCTGQYGSEGSEPGDSVAVDTVDTTPDDDDCKEGPTDSPTNGRVY